MVAMLLVSAVGAGAAAPGPVGPQSDDGADDLFGNLQTWLDSFDDDAASPSDDSTADPSPDDRTTDTRSSLQDRMDDLFSGLFDDFDRPETPSSPDGDDGDDSGSDGSESGGAGTGDEDGDDDEPRESDGNDEGGDDSAGDGSDESDAPEPDDSGSDDSGSDDTGSESDDADGSDSDDANDSDGSAADDSESDPAEPDGSDDADDGSDDATDDSSDDDGSNDGSETIGDVDGSDDAADDAGDGVLDRDNVERYIHQAVNEKRVERGLGELAFDADLRNIARLHSEDMADRGYFSHTSPDGTTVSDRYADYGYDCRAPAGDGTYYTSGENIAYTYYDQPVRTSYGEIVEHTTERELAHGIVDQWMNSDSHRENMLAGHWNNEGVGIHVTDENRVYATQNFC